MRRFTVMGFTEAELGFVLAAVFAAFAVIVPDEGAARTSTMQTELDSVRTQRDSITAEYARLRDSLAAAPAPKRSNKVPQCWEKGETREPITALRVRGKDLYELEGRRLTFAGVRRHFAAQLARSDSLNCRYVVRAHLSPGVDALDQSRAVWQLRRLFDVDDSTR